MPDVHHPNTFMSFSLFQCIDGHYIGVITEAGFICQPSQLSICGMQWDEKYANRSQQNVNPDFPSKTQDSLFNFILE